MVKTQKELSKVFLSHGVDTTRTTICIGDGISEFVAELALKEVGCEKTGVFVGGWKAYKKSPEPDMKMGGFQTSVNEKF